jgi:formylglycine-generating enzyme required for sulfatase activity
VSLITTRGADKDIDSYIPVNDVQDPNTFVVIISNENYKYEEAVPFALNDGSTFKLYCEKALGIPEKNIKYVPNASLNDMKYFLSWLEKVMKAYNGEARAIFYYSGHGMPDDTNKQSFLLPVDGHSTSPESGLSTETLYSRLGSLQSAATMVFLDACFSGASRDGGMMQSSRGVAITPKKNTVSSNMVVFSATKGNETAYPYRDKNHGMFTYFILEKLNERGGCVSLGELSDYVRGEVSRMSMVENEKSQTPTILASVGNTDWSTWKLANTAASKYANIPRNLVKTPNEEAKNLSINTSVSKKKASEKNKLALSDGKITVNGVAYEMVRIDKGTFAMGSSAKLSLPSTFSMDMPRHNVTLKAYAIGKTEVPQAIWEAIMDDNPSENRGALLPVENVTWEQCQTFITKLNQQLGTQFRLPTEAEWEYAADCGNSMNSESFSGSKRHELVAHTGASTIDCGSLKPSSIGIYDMSGNVAEWCQDYISRYSPSPQTNPTGPRYGYQRVVRGGSYKDEPDLLRNSHRDHKRQNECAPHIGLRLAHDM